MANNCQVPTPPEYVDKLLDYIEYTHDLYNKSVLENSCGEGNILKEIVKRYIIDSLENGYNNDQIIHGLEDHVTGYDTDPICIKKCIESLDLIAKEYGLVNIHWNVHEKDYLKCASEKYQYVIGNPPYITYHDLDVDQRIFLRETFDTCKEGRFDYCYAFIEAGLRDLDVNGKLAYIVPYGVIRNKYAEKTRSLIKEHLKGIVDYTEIQLFPNTVTSSVIILCDKQSNDEVIYYRPKDNVQKIVSKCALSNKWIFEEQKSGVRRFGDYFRVTNSVATLLNKVFIFEANHADDEFYYLNDGKVEKAIVFDAASPKSEKKHQNTQIRDKIIFPYKNSAGKISSYQEEEFKEAFPACYSYLESQKEKLLNRKSSDGVQWFEYGRVQAINNIFANKLIMSVVITDKVKVYNLGCDAIPYAGIFIRTLRENEMDLIQAKEILESDSFYKYVKQCGTPTTTSSYRISVKDIENYCF